jgi:hypothetical protein
MQSMRIRIFLVLFVLFLIYPSSLFAATERRIALVIGNGSYDFGRLRNSVNDANDIAATLKKLGFSVILKNNVGHKEMETAIKELGRQLKKDDVGFFFYAGHGVQIEGQNYLIPIGANIEEESDVRYRAVNLSRILDVMESTGNRLNIIILDACRNNPYAKSFRSTTRGLAIVEKSPKDTLIAYSTSPNQVAIDGSGRNSPYTKALLDNITIPGMPIEQVFKKVRNSLDKVTGGKQVPWYISSLGGDFYFNTDSAKMVTDKAESVASKTSPTDELEKDLLEQRKALAEEKRKLEEERKQLAMGSPSSITTANEIKRDGRFIAYGNGTVLDTRTNLMWAAKDNGGNINWQDAKSYCENYRGGGYTDWRMPTQGELEGLHDVGKSKPNEAALFPLLRPLHLTELIDLTSCCPWASETRGSGAASVDFGGGGRLQLLGPQSDAFNYRALPVRSGK